jgi:putative amidase-like protein
MPAKEFEAATYPVQVVETASASTAPGTTHCPPDASPCGRPELKEASQYAVFWGNENHMVAGHRARNPFYEDFGDNNCTNFISQIIRAGGTKFMRYLHKGHGSWWYKRLLPWEHGEGAEFFSGEYTQSWTLADILPQHLWEYGLAHIDPVQEPYGWTKGNIMAEDWFGTNGKGDFNHLQYVVGTESLNGVREPLIANESSPGSNYPHMPWYRVRERIQKSEGQDGWQRVALAWKHTIANPGEYRQGDLYGPGGLHG